MVPPMASRLWLRSIGNFLIPRPACRRGFSSSRRATPSGSWRAEEDRAKLDCRLKGNTPAFWQINAMPARAGVCSTQPASFRIWWPALWMVKTASVTGIGVSWGLLQAWSTLTRLLAVIVSNIRPQGGSGNGFRGQEFAR